MPWEKTFDINEAIDRATQVFWAKGYEATSISDLLKAIGINKGSFYNAFGSKKALFTLSLLKYDREHRRDMLSKLTELDNPVLAISTLFDQLIEQSLTDEEKKGCLVVNTALDLPNHDKDTEKTVKKGLSDFEAFFKQQIKLGLSTGAIPPHVDAKVTSRGLMTLVVGLRVLARGVFDRPALKDIKTQAIHLIK
jgi:TetR/AcrR family transcriptional regulator, transcriptional repressor for nem operon